MSPVAQGAGSTRSCRARPRSACGRWTRPAVADALPPGEVHLLFADRAGRLWIAVDDAGIGKLTTLRGLTKLNLAQTHLRQAAGVIAHAELFAEELRLAQNALSEITGEFTSDDLLGVIFSSFCIGK